MAKNIMIQGTMSSAGKSLLVTALCRIFRQDGYRVAPFKSQNMALNSYVTPDGLELGRAQAVQAEAAGLECNVHMNPILLKPNSDMGSQLIVNGEVRGNYPAAEYFRMKKSLIPDILSAYESLSSENDMIVIEGAGSPAEINLRADDIVNMGLAELVNAPVLLVGDIDRGGVFAQLYGTAALLRPEERARLEGLVINKFRGDRALLRPGLCQIEDLTGIPVLGVIPWTDADIDDEDSLSPRFSRRAAADAVLDLAVIRLPHISNFTDFAPLEACPALGLRYVDRAEKLGRPDLLILPGTKNTISDLQWLRKVGLAEAVLSLAEADVPILGICGGFQMMGKTIRDPEALESGDSSDGLGLLPCETVFFRQKVRTRRNALVETGPFSGVGLTGYEIHMGSTENFGAAAFSRFSDGTADGAQCGNRFGTYLHGLFDSGAMITALTGWLASRKGISLPETASIPAAAYRQQQYDLLADLVRNNLDLDRVYRIMEEYQHAGSSSSL